MKTIITPLILLLVTIEFANAQNVFVLLKDAESRGDEYFAHYAYHEASEAYKKAILKDKEDKILKLKLAETYVKLNDPKDAAYWYEQVLTDEKFQYAVEHYLHYAEALKVIGETELSNQMFSYYQESFNSDGRIKRRMRTLNDEESYKNYIKDIQVKLASFNSEASDFSPTYHNGDLVIVSSRENNRAVRRSCSWINDNYLDLYKVDTATGNVSHFLQKSETKYHEGPSVFKDTVMYFTKNNYDKNNLNRDHTGTSRLKIYESKMGEDGKWGAYEALSFSKDSYSCGHPTLTEDGKTMYFASDMPGGYGGVDIYKVSYVNNRWSKPVNLGRHINTEGNEVFPHIHNDSILFFSSNGHHGFGGLDIYYSDVTHENMHYVRNLGAPINSNYDDFGVLINESEMSGYFSSNRNGEGRHHDDIFEFSSDKSIIDRLLIEGTVVNALDNTYIIDAKIELLDSKMRVIDAIASEVEANYAFEVLKEGRFYLRTSKPGFMVSIDTINITHRASHAPLIQEIAILSNAQKIKGKILNRDTRTPVQEVHITVVDQRNNTVVYDGYSAAEGEFHYDMGLERIKGANYIVKMKKPGYLTKTVYLSEEMTAYRMVSIPEDMLYMDELQVGLNIGDLLSIEPIYFDVGQSELSFSAMQELDKVVKSMKENPTICIELNSYTDTRGNSNFNYMLSNKRAELSVKYMLNKGVDEDRIAGRGHGEAKIINNCHDDVDCSEEEHKVNRRTEFNLVSF